MDRDQQNYHAMLRSVLLCFTRHEPAAASPPMMATLRGWLTTEEAALSTDRRRQGDPIAGLAENKELLKKEMVPWAMAAAGIGLSHANFTGNNELARKLNVARSALTEQADIDCRDRCQALLEEVTAATVRPTLVEWGLTDVVAESADDLVDEFSDLIGKPRQLVIERKGATDRIAARMTKVRAGMDGVLDPFMRQYGLPVNTPEGLGPPGVARRLRHGAEGPGPRRPGRR
jgi:hypothetical protein